MISRSSAAGRGCLPFPLRHSTHNLRPGKQEVASDVERRSIAIIKDGHGPNGLIHPSCAAKGRYPVVLARALRVRGHHHDGIQRVDATGASSAGRLREHHLQLASETAGCTDHHLQEHLGLNIGREEIMDFSCACPRRFCSARALGKSMTCRTREETHPHGSLRTPPRSSRALRRGCRCLTQLRIHRLCSDSPRS